MSFYRADMASLVEISPIQVILPALTPKHSVTTTTDQVFGQQTAEKKQQGLVLMQKKDKQPNLGPVSPEREKGRSKTVTVHWMERYCFYLRTFYIQKYQ